MQYGKILMNIVACSMLLMAGCIMEITKNEDFKYKLDFSQFYKPAKVKASNNS